MLRDERRSRPAAPPDGPPLLLVVIDTEEEFDWSEPRSRDHRSVATIAAQANAQAIFRRHGVIPTYVVDHPVVADRGAVEVLKDFLERGECGIGTHLHPWVSPPDDEAVTDVNSYAGNLPAALEREKLTRLTDTITEAFGAQPVTYRAGRYGIGPNTAEILEDLGYLVDTSVLPYFDLRGDGGPDFRYFTPRPYWFGTRRRLLEVPVTCGLTGHLRGIGAVLFAATGRSPLVKSRAVLARTGLLERIKLSPEEDCGVDDLKRLTTTLLADGCTVFCYSYHSPSCAVGHTPYVRSAAELERFLAHIDGYLGWFLGSLGGRAVTPVELYRLLDGRAGAPTRP